MFAYIVNKTIFYKFDKNIANNYDRIFGLYDIFIYYGKFVRYIQHSILDFHME